MKTLLTIAFASALLASQAHALWSTTTYSNGANPTSIVAAEAIVTAGFTIGTPNSLFAYADFVDPDTNGGAQGNVTSNFPFPGNAAGDQNFFVVVSKGTLNVAAPGVYEFINNTDDGSRLQINGTDIIFDSVLAGNHDASSNVLFPGGVALAAGSYSIRHMWYESGGGAEGDLSVRLFSGGALQPLGDPINSLGLLVNQQVPEPSTLMLIGLGLGSLMIYSRRNRRKAASIVAGLVALSLIGSTQAALVLQYSTWPPSDPVINTGTTGTSGSQVTPADATIVAGPIVGSAVHITANSANSYINANLTTGAGGVNIQGNSFTAGAWVNLDSTGGDHMVFGTDWTGGGSALHLGFRNATPHFGFFANDSDAGVINNVSAGAWHYWVWRYDAGAGAQSIFRDGAQLYSQGGHGAFASNLPLQVGRGIGGGNLNGALDDVRIYDTALSNAAITSLFAEVSAVPEPSTFMLIGLGLVGLYAGFKRSKK